jgi:methylglutamate dehydrogenase subunit B
MRIPCPYCGRRDSSEFSYRGDAAPARPGADATVSAFHDYVYLRDNPAGSIREYWYHASGCRNWLVVERNTLTHDIAAASIAQEVPR